MCHKILLFPIISKYIAILRQELKLTPDPVHVYFYTSKSASQKVKLFKLPQKKKNWTDYEETEIVMRIVFFKILNPDSDLDLAYRP